MTILIHSKRDFWCWTFTGIISKIILKFRLGDTFFFLHTLISHFARVKSQKPFVLGSEQGVRWQLVLKPGQRVKGSCLSPQGETNNIWFEKTTTLAGLYLPVTRWLRLPLGLLLSWCNPERQSPQSAPPPPIIHTSSSSAHHRTVYLLHSDLQSLLDRLSTCFCLCSLTILQKPDNSAGCKHKSL